MCCCDYSVIALSETWLTESVSSAELVLADSNSVNVSKVNDADLITKCDPFHPAIVINATFIQSSQFAINKQQMYNFFNADLNGLLGFLCTIDWYVLFQDLDIDVAVNKFYDILYTAIDKFVPRVSASNKKYPVWFTRELKQLVNKKRILHKQYKIKLGIPNYNIYRQDRNTCTSSKLSGGGVLIAINSSFPSQLIDTTAFCSSVEQVFVSVSVGSKSVLIGAVYIPPSSSIELYSEHCATVEYLVSSNSCGDIVIMGDYNLPGISWNHPTSGVPWCSTSRSSSTSKQAYTVIDSFSFLNFVQYNFIKNPYNNVLDLVFSQSSDVNVSLCDNPLVNIDLPHPALEIDLPVDVDFSFKKTLIEVPNFTDCDYNAVKCMNYNSITTSDEQMIENLFASYFSSVYTDDELLNNVDTLNVDCNNLFLSTHTISESDVLSKLLCLDSHKSMGPDDIPAILLKNCTELYAFH
ncbi:hypothetical protein O3M35_010409 [Rhynocoris fuscipes]|uniref:Endonuclease/exonuclease/phosphatase domain-containing protein n=1 Tax=Rhynocoris fuscipes TaxID=488301 RepID=A0AAW1CZ39_9HEMI